MWVIFFYEEARLSTLSIQNLTKTFGAKTVLKGVSVDIQKGEFFSLLGPSGCGKTTILRIIAGFEEPTSGAVMFDGIHLTTLPPHERPVNTVFQNYALFPHLSVFENIAFGLRIKKVEKSEIDARVSDMLSLVNLSGYGERMITALSGGEKQRVALARALVNRPSILLLDEPLGALDLQLRRKMQFEIKEIHRKIGATFIYVTHDQEEALAMSDRIAVMEGGLIEQLGTPQEIYDRPDSRFVAKFLGSSNLLEGVILSLEPENKSVQVQVEGFEPFASMVRNGAGVGDKVGLVIRPEKIQVLHDNAKGLPAIVEEALYLGSLIQYKLRVGEGIPLYAVDHITAQRSPIRPGQNVRIRWNPQDLVLVER